GNGQLGGSLGSSTPVRVQINSEPIEYLTGVEQIAAGHQHSMALRSDDTVWTWGYNAYKTLGHSDSETYALVAKQVSGLSGIVSIYSGPNSYASFAATSNRMYAWGYNTYHALGIGDGSEENRIVPEAVPFFENNLPKSLHPTLSATLALMPNGDVYGVGFDVWEYTLSTISEIGVTTFAKLEELSEVQNLYAGSHNVFAVGTDGSVKGWGKNGYSNRLLGSYASTGDKYSYPEVLDDVTAYDFSVKPVSNVEVEVDKNTFSVYYEESVFSDHTNVVMEAVYGDGEQIHLTNGRNGFSFYQDNLKPGNYGISLYTTDGESNSEIVTRTVTIEEPTVFLDVTALDSEGEAVTEGTVFVLKFNGEGYDPIAQEELDAAGVARFGLYESGSLKVEIISPGYHDQGKTMTLAVGENAATLRLADESLPDPASFYFFDTDERHGFISGELSWNFYPDETPTFDALQFRYENEAGESLGNVTEEDLSVYQEVAYISGKELDGAVRVRLYTVDEGVPTKTAVSFPIWDFSPDVFVGGAHIIDSDPDRGEYALRVRFDGAEQPGIAENYIVTERAILSEMDPVLLAEAPVGQETRYDIPIAPRLDGEGFVLVFVGLISEDGSVAPWELPIWIPDNTSGTNILDPFEYSLEGNSPENATFFDTDPDEGEIGGPIRWHYSEPFMDAEILFANDSGPIWGSPILQSTIGLPFGMPPEFSEASSESESEMEWPDYFHSLYIPENTEIPPLATRIAIFDRSPFGGGGPPAYVSLVGDVVTVVPAGSGDRFLRLRGGESATIQFSEALSAVSRTDVTDSVYGSVQGDAVNLSLAWAEDGKTVTLQYTGDEEAYFDQDVTVSVTGTTGAIGHHLTIIDVGALSSNEITSSAIGQLDSGIIRKIPLGTTIGELLAGLTTTGHRVDVVSNGDVL
ncbi:MAG TPA: hypothetical protein VEZ72_00105, partial [Paenibacillus sp.]|nr:hypothetical protein [Paenibacillus sp.]